MSFAASGYEASVTQKLPQVQALLSHGGAAEALLPVLRALPAHRAAISAAGWQLPCVEKGVPVSPGPLLKRYLPGSRTDVDVLLIHADPAHALPAWAAHHVAALRQRGTRILAVQRGAFYGSPPPPPLDPDLLLARGGWQPDDGQPARPLSRMPWDNLALWGPAFKSGLPAGSRSVVTGSPVLETLAGQTVARHAARMDVARVLGTHPGKPPAIVAFKLHAHWWPEERVHALLCAVLEAVRERNLHPVILPHEDDGADAWRIYRATIATLELDSHSLLTPRVWRRLDLATWLTGSGAVITQGGTLGILGAALGTPALAIVPPDTAYYPDPVDIGGHYRVLREPLSYVRAGLEAALEELGREAHDPTAFRQHAARGPGAAEEIARVALDMVARRRKGKPGRTAIGPREEPGHEAAGQTVARGAR